MSLPHNKLFIVISVHEPLIFGFLWKIIKGRGQIVHILDVLHHTPRVDISAIEIEKAQVGAGFQQILFCSFVLIQKTLEGYNSKISILFGNFLWQRC